MFTNLDDLMRAVLNILPNAQLGEDNDGQIVVYTNLTVIEDDGSIQDMDELDEMLYESSSINTGHRSTERGT